MYQRQRGTFHNYKQVNTLKEMTIINEYARNKRALKYSKQKLRKLKELKQTIHQ